ncbi:MAG: von Willebrand factor type A domain-containing protein [Propionibacteriaceae bacterium]|nr:von Willebrand factor type A domain-containing protein [Propionibacteriaceae bacterium]
MTLLATGCSGPGISEKVYTAPSVVAPVPGDYPDGLTEAAPAEVVDVEGGDDWRYREIDSTDEFDDSPETPFKDVATSPLSTFSADVDTASYSWFRKQVSNGIAPDGIRIEELVNYFDYDYPAPDPGSDQPFTVTTQVAQAPWAPEHQLALIGVQATKAVPTSEGNNIVLLADVSGSMASEDKLGLLIQAFAMLVEQLDGNDRVSIVTYAGSDQVIADGVPGNQHLELIGKLNSLYADGSTAGAAGITTAYELARKHFIEGGNNRVILATDGDFNVGQSSVEDLTDLIEQQRESGVYISVLGFGMGNLKDNMMESIADHGNGNYAYIDTLNEARKVLVDEFDATMFVVAQDLKLQVEFNPAVVKEYRLIGYNNRRLENEDFDDDTKDAGDVGAGHSVTALYELIPADGTQTKLKYQEQRVGDSTDFLTVKVRYKDPGDAESKLIEQPVTVSEYTETPGGEFAFATAVAELGLLVTDSQYAGQASIDAVIERADSSRGSDPYSLRAEFVDLARAYKQII